jgi:hypothetical protein
MRFGQRRPPVAQSIDTAAAKKSHKNERRIHLVQNANRFTVRGSLVKLREWPPTDDF